MKKYWDRFLKYIPFVKAGAKNALAYKAAFFMWYIISIVATVLIIVLQCVMHTNLKLFHSHHFVKINIVYKDVDGTESEKIKNLFGITRFNKISTKTIYLFFSKNTNCSSKLYIHYITIVLRQNKHFQNFLSKVKK